MLDPSLATLPPAVIASWEYFLHLAGLLVPLFLGASFLVGLVQEYVPPAALERTLRRSGTGVGNLAAAGIDAVTPFCSCSTVPVLAGVLQAGAPLGLAMSFLLASPLVNEIAIVLLLGIFGLEVTVYYVVFTLTAAVVGGIAFDRFGLDAAVKDIELGEAAGNSVVTDGGTNACGCACASTQTQPHRTRIETAGREAWAFFVDTLPYLIMGMVLGAAIHGVVPDTLLHGILGPQNPLAVPLAAIAGAPVYISVSGMLPIATALSDQGIPIGTVLAFVIGGAGVSLPNLVLLHSLFERRLLAAYASTVVVIAIMLGAVFNLLVV